MKARGPHSAACAAIGQALEGAARIESLAKSGSITQADLDAAFPISLHDVIPADARVYYSQILAVAWGLYTTSEAERSSLLLQWSVDLRNLTEAATQVCS